MGINMLLYFIALLAIDMIDSRPVEEQIDQSIEPHLKTETLLIDQTEEQAKLNKLLKGIQYVVPTAAWREKRIRVKVNKAAPTNIDINSNPIWSYSVDPKRPLLEECTSTVYYPEFRWILIKQRKETIQSPHPYKKEVRTAMYKAHNPEECHQPSMTDVLEFLECQIRRHMRLEMGVPKYPAVDG